MDQKKIVLVTGSNRGIGYEIARQCGGKKFRVILSGRNEKKMDQALADLRKENIVAEKLIMDVSNAESIQQAALEFRKMNLTLDVLVNNAGIGVKGDKSITYDNEEILFRSIETNSYGPLRVTKAFLPFISSPGRVIMISSGGGSMTDDPGGWWPAYCVSKTLLNAITRQLAYELAEKNISVNAVCPGWVRTDMGGAGASRSVAKGAETPVWLASEAPQKITGMFFRDKKEIPW